MDELDLKEIFNMFWHKKIFIIIIVILFMFAGFIYGAKFVKPMYSSSTTLVLVSSGSNSNTTSITATDVTMNSKLVETYSKLIKSDKVLATVSQNLNGIVGSEELKSSVSVKAVEDTELIEVTVKNENPYKASQIANEITNVFTKQIQELYNINNVQLVSEAQVPSAPYNKNNVKNILIFGAIGAAAAAICVIVMNMLDTTVKSAEEIEKQFKISVLASIPQMDRKGGKKQ